MTLTTPAHFERIYSHVSFQLRRSKQGVGEAKEFWPEITWLADQLKAGQPAPTEVRNEVNRWHYIVRSRRLVTESPDEETIASFQKQCTKTLSQAEEFLETNPAADTTERWVNARHGILANLFQIYETRNRQAALLDDELHQQLLTMFERVNTASIPDGYQVRDVYGAKFRIYELISEVATHSAFRVRAASIRRKEADPAPALRHNDEHQGRMAPLRGTRQEWEASQRKAAGETGFRAPFAAKDTAGIASPKLKGTEKITAALALKLKGFESKRSTLKRHFAVTPRTDLPYTRRRQASLLESLNAFLSANSKSLTPEQRHQIRELRISIRELRPPASAKGSQYIKVVPGGLATLGKGHR